MLKIEELLVKWMWLRVALFYRRRWPQLNVQGLVDIFCVGSFIHRVRYLLGIEQHNQGRGKPFLTDGWEQNVGSEGHKPGGTCRSQETQTELLVFSTYSSKIHESSDRQKAGTSMDQSTSFSESNKVKSQIEDSQNRIEVSVTDYNFEEHWKSTGYVDQMGKTAMASTSFDSMEDLSAFSDSDYDSGVFDMHSGRESRLSTRESSPVTPGTPISFGFMGSQSMPSSPIFPYRQGSPSSGHGDGVRLRSFSGGQDLHGLPSPLPKYASPCPTPNTSSGDDSGYFESTPKSSHKGQRQEKTVTFLDPERDFDTNTVTVTNADGKRTVMIQTGCTEDEASTMHEKQEKRSNLKHSSTYKKVKSKALPTVPEMTLEQADRATTQKVVTRTEDATHKTEVIDSDIHKVAVSEMNLQEKPDLSMMNYTDESMKQLEVQSVIEPQAVREKMTVQPSSHESGLNFHITVMKKTKTEEGVKESSTVGSVSFGCLNEFVMQQGTSFHETYPTKATQFGKDSKTSVSMASDSLPGKPKVQSDKPKQEAVVKTTSPPDSEVKLQDTTPQISALAPVTFEDVLKDLIPEYSSDWELVETDTELIVKNKDNDTVIYQVIIQADNQLTKVGDIPKFEFGPIYRRSTEAHASSLSAKNTNVEERDEIDPNLQEYNSESPARKKAVTSTAETPTIGNSDSATDSRTNRDLRSLQPVNTSISLSHGTSHQPVYTSVSQPHGLDGKTIVQGYEHISVSAMEKCSVQQKLNEKEQTPDSVVSAITMEGDAFAEDVAAPLPDEGHTGATGLSSQEEPPGLDTMEKGSVQQKLKGKEQTPDSVVSVVTLEGDAFAEDVTVPLLDEGHTGANELTSHEQPAGLDTMFEKSYEAPKLGEKTENAYSDQNVKEIVEVPMDQTGTSGVIPHREDKSTQLETDFHHIEHYRSAKDDKMKSITIQHACVTVPDSERFIDLEAKISVMDEERVNAPFYKSFENESDLASDGGKSIPMTTSSVCEKDIGQHASKLKSETSDQNKHNVAELKMADGLNKKLDSSMDYIQDKEVDTATVISEKTRFLMSVPSEQSVDTSSWVTSNKDNSKQQVVINVTKCANDTDPIKYHYEYEITDSAILKNQSPESQGMTYKAEENAPIHTFSDANGAEIKSYEGSHILKGTSHDQESNNDVPFGKCEFGTSVERSTGSTQLGKQDISTTSSQEQLKSGIDGISELLEICDRYIQNGQEVTLKEQRREPCPADESQVNVMANSESVSQSARSAATHGTHDSTKSVEIPGSTTRHETPSSEDAHALTVQSDRERVADYEVIVHESTPQCASITVLDWHKITDKEPVSHVSWMDVTPGKSTTATSEGISQGRASEAGVDTIHPQPVTQQHDVKDITRSHWPIKADAAERLPQEEAMQHLREDVRQADGTRQAAMIDNASIFHSISAQNTAHYCPEYLFKTTIQASSTPEVQNVDGTAMPSTAAEDKTEATPPVEGSTYLPAEQNAKKADKHVTCEAINKIKTTISMESSSEDGHAHTSTSELTQNSTEKDMQKAIPEEMEKKKSCHSQPVEDQQEKDVVYEYVSREEESKFTKENEGMVSLTEFCHPATINELNSADLSPRLLLEAKICPFDEKLKHSAGTDQLDDHVTTQETRVAEPEETPRYRETKTESTAIRSDNNPTKCQMKRDKEPTLSTECKEEKYMNVKLAPDKTGDEMPTQELSDSSWPSESTITHHTSVSVSTELSTRESPKETLKSTHKEQVSEIYFGVPSSECQDVDSSFGTKLTSQQLKDSHMDRASAQHDIYTTSDSEITDMQVAQVASSLETSTNIKEKAIQQEAAQSVTLPYRDPTVVAETDLPHKPETLQDSDTKAFPNVASVTLSGSSKEGMGKEDVQLSCDLLTTHEIHASALTSLGYSTPTERHQDSANHETQMSAKEHIGPSRPDNEQNVSDKHEKEPISKLKGQDTKLKAGARPSEASHVSKVSSLIQPDYHVKHTNTDTTPSKEEREASLMLQQTCTELSQKQISVPYEKSEDKLKVEEHTEITDEDQFVGSTHRKVQLHYDANQTMPSQSEVRDEKEMEAGDCTSNQAILSHIGPGANKEIPVKNDLNIANKEELIVQPSENFPTDSTRNIDQEKGEESTVDEFIFKLSCEVDMTSEDSVGWDDASTELTTDDEREWAEAMNTISMITGPHTPVKVRIDSDESNGADSVILGPNNCKDNDGEPGPNGNAREVLEVKLTGDAIVQGTEDVTTVPIEKSTGICRTTEVTLPQNAATEEVPLEVLEAKVAGATQQEAPLGVDPNIIPCPVAFRGTETTREARDTENIPSAIASDIKDAVSPININQGSTPHESEEHEGKQTRQLKKTIKLQTKPEPEEIEYAGSDQRMKHDDTSNALGTPLLTANDTVSSLQAAQNLGSTHPEARMITGSLAAVPKLRTVPPGALHTLDSDKASDRITHTDSSVDAEGLVPPPLTRLAPDSQTLTIPCKEISAALLTESSTELDPLAKAQVNVTDPREPVSGDKSNTVSKQASVNPMDKSTVAIIPAHETNSGTFDDRLNATSFTKGTVKGQNVASPLSTVEVHSTKTVAPGSQDMEVECISDTISSIEPDEAVNNTEPNRVISAENVMVDVTPVSVMAIEVKSENEVAQHHHVGKEESIHTPQDGEETTVQPSTVSLSGRYDVTMTRTIQESAEECTHSVVTHGIARTATDTANHEALESSSGKYPAHGEGYEMTPVSVECGADFEPEFDSSQAVNTKDAGMIDNVQINTTETVTSNVTPTVGETTAYEFAQNVDSLKIKTVTTKTAGDNAIRDQKDKSTISTKEMVTVEERNGSLDRKKDSQSTPNTTSNNEDTNKATSEMTPSADISGTATVSDKAPETTKDTIASPVKEATPDKTMKKKLTSFVISTITTDVAKEVTVVSVETPLEERATGTDSIENATSVNRTIAMGAAQDVNAETSSLTRRITYDTEFMAKNDDKAQPQKVPNLINNVPLPGDSVNVDHQSTETAQNRTAIWVAETAKRKYDQLDEETVKYEDAMKKTMLKVPLIDAKHKTENQNEEDTGKTDQKSATKTGEQPVATGTVSSTATIKSMSPILYMSPSEEISVEKRGNEAKGKINEPHRAVEKPLAASDTPWSSDNIAGNAGGNTSSVSMQERKDVIHNVDSKISAPAADGTAVATTTKKEATGESSTVAHRMEPSPDTLGLTQVRRTSPVIALPHSKLSNDQETDSAVKEPDGRVSKNLSGANDTKDEDWSIKMSKNDEKDANHVQVPFKDKMDNRKDNVEPEAGVSLQNTQVYTDSPEIPGETLGAVTVKPPTKPEILSKTTCSASSNIAITAAYPMSINIADSHGHYVADKWTQTGRSLRSSETSSPRSSKTSSPRGSQTAEYVSEPSLHVKAREESETKEPVVHVKDSEESETKEPQVYVKAAADNETKKPAVPVQAVEKTETKETVVHIAATEECKAKQPVVHVKAIEESETQKPATAVKTAEESATKEPLVHVKGIEKSEIKELGLHVKAAKDSELKERPVPVKTAEKSETKEPAVHVKTAEESGTNEPAVHVKAAKEGETEEPAVHVKTAKESETKEPAVHVKTAEESGTNEPAVHVKAAKEGETEEPAVHVKAAKEGETEEPAVHVKTAEEREIKEPAVHIKSEKESETKEPAVHIKNEKESATKEPAVHVKAIDKSEIKELALHIKATKESELRERPVPVKTARKSATKEPDMHVKAAEESEMKEPDVHDKRTDENETKELTVHVKAAEESGTKEPAVHVKTAEESKTKEPAIHVKAGKESETEEPAEHVKTTEESGTKEPAVHVKTAEESKTKEPVVHVKTAEESKTKEPAVHIKTAEKSKTKEPAIHVKTAEENEANEPAEDLKTTDLPKRAKSVEHVAAVKKYKEKEPFVHDATTDDNEMTDKVVHDKNTELTKTEPPVTDITVSEKSDIKLSNVDMKTTGDSDKKQPAVHMTRREGDKKQQTVQVKTTAERVKMQSAASVATTETGEQRQSTAQTAIIVGNEAKIKPVSVTIKDGHTENVDTVQEGTGEAKVPREGAVKQSKHKAPHSIKTTAISSGTRSSTVPKTVMTPVTETNSRPTNMNTPCGESVEPVMIPAAKPSIEVNKTTVGHFPSVKKDDAVTMDSSVTGQEIESSSQSKPDPAIDTTVSSTNRDAADDTAPNMQGIGIHPFVQSELTVSVAGNKSTIIDDVTLTLPRCQMEQLAKISVDHDHGLRMAIQEALSTPTSPYLIQEVDTTGGYSKRTSGDQVREKMDTQNVASEEVVSSSLAAVKESGDTEVSDTGKKTSSGDITVPGNEHRPTFISPLDSDSTQEYHIRNEKHSADDMKPDGHVIDKVHAVQDRSKISEEDMLTPSSPIRTEKPVPLIKFAAQTDREKESPASVINECQLKPAVPGTQHEDGVTVPAQRQNKMLETNSKIERDTSKESPKARPPAASSRDTSQRKLHEASSMEGPQEGLPQTLSRESPQIRLPDALSKETAQARLPDIPSRDTLQTTIRDASSIGRPDKKTAEPVFVESPQASFSEASSNDTSQARLLGASSDETPQETLPEVPCKETPQARQLEALSTDTSQTTVHDVLSVEKAEDSFSEASTCKTAGPLEGSYASDKRTKTDTNEQVQTQIHRPGPDFTPGRADLGQHIASRLVTVTMDTQHHSDTEIRRDKRRTVKFSNKNKQQHSKIDTFSTQGEETSKDVKSSGTHQSSSEVSVPESHPGLGSCDGSSKPSFSGHLKQPTTKKKIPGNTEQNPCKYNYSQQSSDTQEQSGEGQGSPTEHTLTVVCGNMKMKVMVSTDGSSGLVDAANTSTSETITNQTENEQPDVEPQTQYTLDPSVRQPPSLTDALDADSEPLHFTIDPSVRQPPSLTDALDADSAPQHFSIDPSVRQPPSLADALAPQEPHPAENTEVNPDGAISGRSKGKPTDGKSMDQQNIKDASSPTKEPEDIAMAESLTEDSQVTHRLTGAASVELYVDEQEVPDRSKEKPGELELSPKQESLTSGDPQAKRVPPAPVKPPRLPQQLGATDKGSLPKSLTHSTDVQYPSLEEIRYSHEEPNGFLDNVEPELSDVTETVQPYVNGTEAPSEVPVRQSSGLADILEKEEPEPHYGALETSIISVPSLSDALGPSNEDDEVAHLSNVTRMTLRNASLRERLGRSKSPLSDYVSDDSGDGEPGEKENKESRAKRIKRRSHKHKEPGRESDTEDAEKIKDGQPELEPPFKPAPAFSHLSNALQVYHSQVAAHSIESLEQYEALVCMTATAEGASAIARGLIQEMEPEEDGIEVLPSEDIVSQTLPGGLPPELTLYVERHPEWMRHLPERLHNLPLTRICIPGSHISLAIEGDMQTDMEFSRGNREICAYLDTLPQSPIFQSIRRHIKNIWKSWMPKQMQSVGQQLEAGIRYLDIHAAKNQKMMYGEHGLFTKPLVMYLHEIKTFAEAHPTEVIFLHFRKLHNFNRKDKRVLLTTLYHLFQSKLCPVQTLAGVTLSGLWQENKQIIAIFPRKDADSFSSHLLTDLAWLDRVVVTSSARRPTVDELIRRLELLYRLKGHCDDFWHVFQAVRSPDFGQSACQDMRQFTLTETNRALVEWVRDKENLNILVADFVGTSRLVGAIINLNMQKKVETCV